jgi:small subunit ribosomal protein S15
VGQTGSTGATSGGKVSVTKEKKAGIVEEFARKAGDTGSVEVQVAVLSTRIQNLTEHLRGHKKDVSTRRGLLGLVSRRSRLMRYLKRTDIGRYTELVQRLGLRG